MALNKKEGSFVGKQKVSGTSDFYTLLKKYKNDPLPKAMAKASEDWAVLKRKNHARSRTKTNNSGVNSGTTA